MKFALPGAACAAAALAFAIPALAANPAKNSEFQAKGPHNQITPTFATDKTGKHVVNFSFYNDCAPVPILDMPKLAVKAGRFAYSGTVTDVTKKKIKVKITGHFTTSTVAKGTVNFSRAGKACPTKSYTAKRSGKASTQVG